MAGHLLSQEEEELSVAFGYTTIADVLLAIDYTALDSADYREQVIRQLDRSVSADRAYSFRQQFADAWYDLNNPDPTATRFTVQFQTTPQDFPPNLQNLTIGPVLLYFVPSDEHRSRFNPRWN